MWRNTQRVALREINVDTLAGLYHWRDLLVTLKVEKQLYFSDGHKKYQMVSNMTGEAVRRYTNGTHPQLSYTLTPTNLTKNTVNFIGGITCTWQYLWAREQSYGVLVLCYQKHS